MEIGDGLNIVEMITTEDRHIKLTAALHHAFLEGGEYVREVMQGADRYAFANSPRLCVREIMRVAIL